MKRLFTTFLFLQAITSLQAFQVTGNLSQRFSVQAGEEIEGRLSLNHQDENPANFQVFQMDYIFNAEGATEYLPAGSLEHSNASWLSTLRPSSGTLYQGDRQEIRFALKVPEDAQPGTYWSVLMVEPVKMPHEIKERQLVLTTTTRYAVQIIVDVGPLPPPTVHFTNQRIIRKDSGLSLSVDVENVGSVWFNPNARIEIYNAQGATVKTQAFGNRRTFPGTSVRYECDITQLEAGKYEAILILEGADEALAGIYKFEIE